MSEVEEVVDGQPVYDVVPWTGEALAIRDADTEALAVLLEECRDFERARLREFKRDVQDEILRRMDREALWTKHCGSVTLSGDSPDRTEYDVEGLKAELERLVDEDRIDSTAALKAIRAKATYEVSVSGVKALLKLGGDVAARIESCQQPTLRPRSVRIARSGR